MSGGVNVIWLTEELLGATDPASAVPWVIVKLLIVPENGK